MPRIARLTALLTLATGLLVGAATPPAHAQPSADSLPQVLTPAQAAAEHPSFDSYWYQGLAELSRYRLEQSRYGEIHEGEAVLIFVTEDFLTDLQVKWDHGDRSQAIPILKLNSYRRFYTGLYPYTIMTSVFVPVAGAATTAMKVSFVATEWCGNTYTQLNLRDRRFEGLSHSYFQREADSTFTLDQALLEDEIWVQIRRDPAALPVGTVSVIPSVQSSRLMHQPLQVQSAHATLDAVPAEEPGGTALQVYTLTYDDPHRTLRITFQASFPHQITAWEETQTALFNPSGGDPLELTTRAVLTDSVMLDYWNRHDVADAPYREVLGLTH